MGGGEGLSDIPLSDTVSVCVWTLSLSSARWGGEWEIPSEQIYERQLAQAEEYERELRAERSGLLKATWCIL